MRVLIDGYYLDKPRGMGRYVQELLHALALHADPDIELTVAVPEDTAADFLIAANIIKYFRKPRKPFPVWEQLLMPLLLRGGRFDVVHFPYNTKPVIINLMRQAHVVTIHDLIFLESSGTGLYQALGNKYRSWVLKAAAHGRVSLISDTDHGAKLIGRHLDYPVGYAYIPVEHFASSVVSATAASGGAPYCLHIGGISPHKNTARCIAAFIAAGQPDVNLVVLGLPADSELARRHASSRVLFPGWVSDQALAGFIARAEAVLFPSLMEGYGLPIVEAFAFGKPLLTSNLPPMNELTGDAAVLVDPLSVDSIRDGIKSIVSDPALRSVLIDKGTRRINEISSRTMAAKMIGFYRAAALSR